MDSKTLNYEYVRWMTKAEQANSRQEAVDCINKATQLKAAFEVARQHEAPLDRYARWCGGPGGFDDFAERLH